MVWANVPKTTTNCEESVVRLKSWNGGKRGLGDVGAVEVEEAILAVLLDGGPLLGVGGVNSTLFIPKRLVKKERGSFGPGVSLTQ